VEKKSTPLVSRWKKEVGLVKKEGKETPITKGVCTIEEESLINRDLISFSWGIKVSTRLGNKKGGMKKEAGYGTQERGKKLS